MPSRSSSLKTALLAYKPEPGYGGTLDRLLIEQWIKRCNEKNLDESLRAILRVMEPLELIRLVAWAGHEVRGTASRMHGSKKLKIDGIDQKWKKLHKKLTAYPSLRNLQILADAHNLHLDAIYAGCLGVLKQRDANGQMLFRVILSDRLHTQFGRRFDTEVAILTEIAFDLPDGSVSPEHITDARRQR